MKADHHGVRTEVDKLNNSNLNLKALDGYLMEITKTSLLQCHTENAHSLASFALILKI